MEADSDEAFFEGNQADVTPSPGRTSKDHSLVMPERDSQSSNDSE